MNILHVLSQFEVTGAEIYAITLMKEQQKKGHHVFVTSDTFSQPYLFNYFTLNVGDRRYLNRIRIIRILKDFVQEKKIDIIHAHSRAASWVCYFVSLGTNTPLISTIHGRQHIHLSNKLFNIYGDEIIAVCENIRDHLKNRLKIKSGIKVIRNGFNMEGTEITDKFSNDSNIFVISIIGRLSGPKGKFVHWFIKNVIPKCYEKDSNILFRIIGGQIVPLEIPSIIDELNNYFGKKVIIAIPHQNDLTPHIENSDLIIGSGRVAIECMRFNKPVVAIGESKYIGLVTKDTLEEALETNFGDCNDFVGYNEEVVTNDLMDFVSRKSYYIDNLKWYQDFVRKNFNIISIAEQIEDIYLEKISIRKSHLKNITVLIYHKVVDKILVKPKHQTYVTGENFEKQLKFLLDLGFTPITFKDCYKCFSRKASLPGKPIIITFDDGYKDIFTVAFPIAKKFRIKFVVFTIGKDSKNNFWDVDDQNFSSDLLASEELLEMHNYGVEIGSHSVNHKSLITLDKNEIYYEVQKSKEYLENIIFSEVISFSYPYGDVNETVKDIVRYSGYKFGAATITGPLNFFKDRFEIRRIPVFPNTTLLGLRKKISPWYSLYKEIKKFLKNE
jgi:peptidoglycan/xylan/chitin deacetylase (PgdA/CDA1 family)